MVSLVLGLGNVGKKYEKTRHNVGFLVIEKIIEAKKFKPEAATRHYHWCVMGDGPDKVVLATPKTYMNLSGVAAAELLERFEMKPSQMLVVVDDFNLSLGKLRFRKSGSDGGHNGLASITETLGTETFPRLRLGIGPAPEGEEVVDYVLGKFSKEEQPMVNEMVNTASEAVLLTLEHSLDEAMTRYNRNPA